MNHVLSFVQAARTSSDPGHSLYSNHMLAELLALHEEMIVQLRLERPGVVGSADFHTGMIDQQEKTAAMLRAKLEIPEADTTNDGVFAFGPSRTVLRQRSDPSTPENSLNLSCIQKSKVVPPARMPPSAPSSLLCCTT
jgi:hypothetical protein